MSNKCMNCCEYPCDKDSECKIIEKHQPFNWRNENKESEEFENE